MDNIGSQGNTQDCGDYSIYAKELYSYMQPKREPVPRFSRSHIEKVLREVYDHYTLQPIGGYKANRYRRFCTYNVLDADGNIIMRNVTLAAIGNYLKSQEDY